jgi:hypothetical protein
LFQDQKSVFCLFLTEVLILFPKEKTIK